MSRARASRATTIALREFQEEGVLALVGAALDTLRKISLAPANRRRITREQGYALLEAPTGSGKTVMLAQACERISRDAPIVWFWFAPFAGVVDQTGGALNAAAPALRVRLPGKDRALEGTRPGDVFVATWASVATRSRDSRRARVDDDVAISLDTLLDGLRAAGFCIGAVVDEAHHSFNPDTQPFAFFNEVLRPDLVMLATATPNDAKIEILRRALDVRRFQRVSVSRSRVVEARLNKQQVRVVTFTSEGASSRLVDLNEVAIRAAVAKHRELKADLASKRISVVPLLLIQVASDNWDPVKVRNLLHTKLGFALEAVGVHTAAEPDADVHALARDPAVEVLIFKMAVATGFDAPRASTLCALRAVRDPAFGLQVVGRIMRVHPHMQARAELPVELDTGWVFLGDADGQQGLLDAAERIKAIRDAISVMTDGVQVTNINLSAGGQLTLRDEDGQSSFVLEPDLEPQPLLPFAPDDEPAEEREARTNRVMAFVQGSTSLFGDLQEQEAPPPHTGENAALGAGDSAAGRGGRAQAVLYRYPRREGIILPEALLTEKMPRDVAPLLADIVRNANFTNEHLLAAVGSHRLEIERQERELFEGRAARRTAEQGVISEFLAREQAHRVLSICGHIPPADFGRAMMAKLNASLERAGHDPLPERDLRRALNVVLSRWPEIARDAVRRGMSACLEAVPAAPLPVAWESPVPLIESPLNAYGVMPAGMNSWEQAFARWLDRQPERVIWWLRNVPRPNSANDWGVRIELPESRAGFYPDFVVCVDGRKAEMLLAETKERMLSEDTETKTRSEHARYGRALMLAWQEEHARFIRYEYDPSIGRNVPRGRLEPEHLVDGA